MIAIYKREVKSYFTSMIGCVFIAFFMAIGGLYFMAYNLTYGYEYVAYVVNTLTFFLIFGIPVITMKCFAEDKKNKTDQLLMTAPISLNKIVFGKYLAMITMFAIPNLVYCIYPLIVKSFGVAHFLIDYTSILVFYMMGCVYISVGMYISSKTESQVIAVILSIVVLYVLYMWESLVSFLPFTTLASVLAEFSIPGVLYNLAIGRVLDVTGIIAYISIAGVFVFLTVQALQKRRWN